jgi:hypothetical protein
MSTCYYYFSGITAGITGGWVGRDAAALPEPTLSHEPARKRGESHPSGARCAGRTLAFHGYRTLVSSSDTFQSLTATSISYEQALDCTWVGYPRIPPQLRGP